MTEREFAQKLNPVYESIKKVKKIQPQPGDITYLDAFNHLIHKYIYEKRKQYDSTCERSAFFLWPAPSKVDPTLRIVTHV